MSLLLRNGMCLSLFASALMHTNTVVCHNMYCCTHTRARAHTHTRNTRKDSNLMTSHKLLRLLLMACVSLTRSPSAAGRYGSGHFVSNSEGG